ncbi:MAG: spore maturation protein, partial [Clostridiales bacterium]|nr:spore maturation protein [Clostridiales bacterium]
MLSKIWKLMIVIALVYGMFTGRAEQLSSAAVKSAGDAVTLCISLCGIYALWCGLMKLAEAGGLLNALSRLLSPLIKRLFPQAAKSKEASSAITMNLAANMLGLGNAATPAGQKAMRELKKLSGHDRATDDMVTL